MDSVLRSQQDHCSPELIEAIYGVSIKPVQDQASQHSRMGEGGRSAHPKLVTVDGCFGRESQVSLRVWHLLDQPCPSNGHTPIRI